MTLYLQAVSKSSALVLLGHEASLGWPSRAMREARGKLEGSSGEQWGYKFSRYVPRFFDTTTFCQPRSPLKTSLILPGDDSRLESIVRH